MITDKQKYAMVNQFRAHSLSVIRKNQKTFLPVLNTGKNDFWFFLITDNECALN